MLYTIFNKKGYEIKSNEWKEKLVNLEGYNWLFDFISFDLTKLADELEKQKMTLLKCLKNINRDTIDESELCYQAKIIERIHPFYKMIIKQENHPFFQYSEGMKYLVEEVLFQLFDELINEEKLLSIMEGNSNIVDVFKISGYSNIIDFLQQNNLNSFFMIWYTKRATEKYIHSSKIPFFYDLIRAQSKLLSWSFIFLDLDAKYLNKLSKRERISIYGFYCNSVLNSNSILEKALYTGKVIIDANMPDISVTERLYFSNIDNNVGVINFEGKEFWAPEQTEIQIRLLLSLKMAHINPKNKDIGNNLKLIVENYNREFTTENYFVKEIVSPNIFVLMEYEFSRLIDSEEMIRKCKRCGKYLITTNKKTLYCTRVNYETNTRCCDENPKKRYVEKLKKLGIYDAYNEINNKIRYRVKLKKERKYPLKNEQEIIYKRNKLLKAKEELVKLEDLENAKKSIYYSKFFNIYEEIKSLL